MNTYECSKHGLFQAEKPQCEDCKMLQRVTWVTHYKLESVKPDFDAKQFAGELAGERVALAEKAIHSIGSPFMSAEADLTCGDKGIDAIESRLNAAVKKLVAELKKGKRSVVKAGSFIDLG